MGKRILDRVSYHAVYDTSILEALRYAKDNGFAGIQVADETPHLSFEVLSDQAVEQVAQFVSEESLYITLHAPDNTASLFQCSRHLADGVINYYRALLAFARAVRSPSVTVHLGSRAVFGTDDDTGRRIPPEDLPLYAASLKRNLEALLAMAAGRHLICVENYDIGLPELALLTPYLGRDGLYLCWDLAKSVSTPDVAAFYRAHPGWIKQVHLHDRREVKPGSFKSHRAIGTGTVDTADHLRFLIREADVIDYCIEVRPRERAKDSLAALQSIANEIGGE